MELALIAAGVVAAYFFLRPQAPAPGTSTTPAPGNLPADLQAAGYTYDASGQLRKPAGPTAITIIPSAPTFSGAGSSVSGGYQIAPANTSWGNPMLIGKGANTGAWFGTPADPSASIANAVAVSAATLASAISSPPNPAPPPLQRGGISGTVGSGGKPLGGPLRTGLSSGTGTTVVGTTRLQLLPLTKTLY